MTIHNSSYLFLSHNNLCNLQYCDQNSFTQLQLCRRQVKRMSLAMEESARLALLQKTVWSPCCGKPQGDRERAVPLVEVAGTHVAPLFINRLGTLRHLTWLKSVSFNRGWHYRSQGHPHQGSALSSRGSHWAVHPFRQTGQRGCATYCFQFLTRCRGAQMEAVLAPPKVQRKMYSAVGADGYV